MPNKKISALNLNTSPTVNDVFPIVNNGETKKLTLDGLSTFLTPFVYVFLTGGTYSGSTIILTNNNNTSFEITGVTTGNINFIDKTYSELYNMYSSNTLNAGSYYRITDFQTCYDQPDYDYNGIEITSGNYRTADIDPIIVFAISSNTLSNIAYQQSYPNDSIKYDITFNTTEVTNSPAKGRITERIDEFNNRTDYDHRAIKFKRYRTHFLNGYANGRIIEFANGLVYGDNTTFTTDFSVGSVIFIESSNPNFYKVVSITSDVEMFVHGYNYSNFSDNFGYRIWFTQTRTFPDSEPVSLEYKQNNFSGETEYYEQFTFNNINNYLNNYIGDFANLRDWDNHPFLLSNNIFTNADDNTVDVLSNNFGNNFYNNSFGDDVISNLFVGQTFYKNTFYDRIRYNIIKRNFHDNIWYNNEMNSNNIGDDFYNNWNVGGNFNNNDINNEFNFNSIKGNFYENRIHNFFYSNSIYSEFYKNDFLDNIHNNYFYGDFYDNKIGSNFADNKIWSEMYDNQFGSSVNNNNFGYIGNINAYLFAENRFGNDMTSNNFSGETRFNHVQTGFQNNRIKTGFLYNHIGSFFIENNIDEFFGSILGQNNNIGDYFQFNTIGKFFYNNKISSYFSENIIGNNFQNNNIEVVINTIDFTQYLGNISSITYTALGSSATNGTYVNVTGSTGGNGINATFNIQVFGNVVTSVVINNSGKLYNIGDTILILGSQINGTDGIDDVTITITLVSKPSVYQPYSSYIFQRESGTNRLLYYDSNDILTIKNINE